MNISMLLMIIVSIICSSSTVKAESQIRSSSLRMVTTQDGNVTRIDYLDSDGRITYAADKHYASLIKSKFGNIIFEEYLDSKGQPAKQTMGYYAICRKYDSLGRNDTIVFLDSEGLPVMTINRYAMIRRTFYDNGTIKSEQYYDTDGVSIDTGYYGYGCHKEYDPINNSIVQMYYGIDGEPVITQLGYAISKRVYYDQNSGEKSGYDEFYYDEKGEPICLSHGQFGIHREFDELGRESQLTFLDQAGMSIRTIEGYTTIKRTFYEDDSIKTERYYDLLGKPFRLSEGQYGVLYRDGSVYYLDITGTEFFNIKQFLYNNEILILIIGFGIIYISIISNKKMNVMLLLSYTFAMLYFTVLFRSKVTVTIDFTLKSYQLFFYEQSVRRGIINNIVLFMPLGTILYRLYPNKRIILIPVVTSIIIEMIQYFTKTGLVELDDVVSNSLGGIFGYYVAYIFIKVKKRKRSVVEIE